MVLPEGSAWGREAQANEVPIQERSVKKKYNGVVYECLCDETEAPCGG